MKRPKQPAPAPTRDSLREVAYAYLGRAAASEAQVKARLGAAITAWARRAAGAGDDEHEIATAVEAARALVPEIVADLASSRLLDDARFAAARAARLGEAGKSRRVILLHLASKGVDTETAHGVVPRDDAVELDAALRFARKRRLGPFARDDDEPTRETRQKQLGAMARAGFDVSTCERVLRLGREEAEERLGTRGGW